MHHVPWCGGSSGFMFQYRVQPEFQDIPTEDGEELCDAEHVVQISGMSLDV